MKYRDLHYWDISTDDFVKKRKLFSFVALIISLKISFKQPYKFPR